MYCPFCSAQDTKVIDSRLVADGGQVRRRRECLSCNERFTTFETAELVMPRLVKSDGTRQPFDEAKLRAGMLRALEKPSPILPDPLVEGPFPPFPPPGLSISVSDDEDDGGE